MDNLEAIAKLRYLRMSPRKVSMATRAVVGMSVSDAGDLLKFAQKGAARPILKLLNSCSANARNKGIAKETLKIKEILVGPGPTLKRGRFVSKGGHHKIMKRTTHVTIKLIGSKVEEKVSKKEAK